MRMEETITQTPTEDAPVAAPTVAASAAAVSSDVITLPAESQELVIEAMQGISVLYQALGEERERYRQTEIQLLRGIHERRLELEKLMNLLTRKHVPDAPGQWDWIPEAGAFIRKKEPVSGNGA